jgi:hypothetical protein
MAPCKPGDQRASHFGHDQPNFGVGAPFRGHRPLFGYTISKRTEFGRRFQGANGRRIFLLLFASSAYPAFLASDVVSPDVRGGRCPQTISSAGYTCCGPFVATPEAAWRYEPGTRPPSSLRSSHASGISAAGSLFRVVIIIETMDKTRSLHTLVGLFSKSTIISISPCHPLFPAMHAPSGESSAMARTRVAPVCVGSSRAPILRSESDADQKALEGLRTQGSKPCRKT